MDTNHLKELMDMKIVLEIVLQKLEGICNRLSLEHDDGAKAHIEQLQRIRTLHTKQLELLTTLI